MNRFFLLLAALFALVPTASLAATGDDRAALLALEARWNKAISDRDAATAGEIISEDFRFIAANGQVYDRAAVLASTADPDFKIEPFVTEDVEVRIHGDTAVLTGRFRQSGHYKGTAYAFAMRYTDVYVRQGNGWRAISAHASLIR